MGICSVAALVTPDRGLHLNAQLKYERERVALIQGPYNVR